MTIETSTLRPGLLVSLKTSVSGNVSYVKVSKGTRREEGREIAEWETVRTIIDKEEHEAAQTVRSEAQALIRGVCAKSAFGLLCPEIEKEKLDTAIAKARARIRGFNEEAKLSRIQLNVIAGRIASDDVEAVKAINSEVSDLMRLMNEGIANCDPKAIRDAANRTRSIGQMLSGTAAARVQLVIETARKVARDIVASGETAAQVIDKAAIAKITEQRTAFLDLEEMGDVAAPVGEARAVDFDPEAEQPRNDPRNGYQPDAPEIDLGDDVVVIPPVEVVARALDHEEKAARAAALADAKRAEKSTKSKTKRKTRR